MESKICTSKKSSICGTTFALYCSVYFLWPEPTLYIEECLFIYDFRLNSVGIQFLWKCTSKRQKGEKHIFKSFDFILNKNTKTKLYKRLYNFLRKTNSQINDQNAFLGGHLHFVVDSLLKVHFSFLRKWPKSRERKSVWKSRNKLNITSSTHVHTQHAHSHAHSHAHTYTHTLIHTRSHTYALKQTELQ